MFILKAYTEGAKYSMRELGRYDCIVDAKADTEFFAGVEDSLTWKTDGSEKWKAKDPTRFKLNYIIEAYDGDDED